MGILLAENKKSKVDIVISPAADRVVRFAAGEMRSYLKKMSGADFRVIEKDFSVSLAREPAIFITADFLPFFARKPCGPACNAMRSIAGRLPQGGSSVAKAAMEDRMESLASQGSATMPRGLPRGASPGGKTTDTFTISAKAGRVWIRGDKGRSALYGVYEFLEILGCRFVEPGKEVIPAQRTLMAPVINREYSAAFSLRNIFRVQMFSSKTAQYEGLEPGRHLPQIDWMAKRKLNHYEFYVDFFRYDLWEKHKHHVLNALLDRGFDLEVTHHSIHYFCPPDEAHDFGNYGPATYRSNHPDWYIGPQTRIDKPAVQTVIRERYLEYLRKNPELGMAGLWPDDTNVHSAGRGFSPTDEYMKFWNNMAKALATEFPEKRLSILAYYELLKPPRKVAPASNLHCWFCPIDANYMYPITDKSLSRTYCRITPTRQPNRIYLDYLKPWIKKMPPGQVSTFEYYGWQGVLTPLAGKMKQDLAVYHDLQVGGVRGWCGFTYNLMGPDFRWARDLYVFSHLLWNPGQDLAPLETAWAQGVFGRAAGDIVDFYQALARAHEKEIKKGLLTRASWISLDLLHRGQKILASARRNAAEPESARRINLLERIACQGCTEKIFRKSGDWDKFL